MVDETASRPVPTGSEMLTFSEHARRGNIAQLEIFIKKYGTAHINYQDSYGWTALMCASCNKTPDALIFLLQHGASPEITTVQGLTARMIAEINGYPANARYLEQYTYDLIKKREADKEKQAAQKKIDARVQKLKQHRTTPSIKRNK